MINDNNIGLFIIGLGFLTAVLFFLIGYVVGFNKGYKFRSKPTQINIGNDIRERRP